MRKIVLFPLIFLMSVVLLSSCAKAVDVSPCLDQKNVGDVYTFWDGVWHGMIIPFDLCVSYVSKDVVIYSVNNDGAGYNTGYAIGIVLGMIATVSTVVSIAKAFSGSDYTIRSGISYDR